MVEKWDSMSSEDLCLEYQQTRDNDLYEYFLDRNKGLIYYFTKNVIRKHLSQIELIEQLGRQAMWQAMLKYDKSRNAKFSTMFYYYILKNLRQFYDEVLDIRLPVYVRDKLNEFKLKHQDDNFIYDTISLSTEIHNDGENRLLEDVIASDINIEEEINGKIIKENILKTLHKLSPREANLVDLYFGISDGIPKTLQILGDKYGVSRERIRQIISKALIKLKRIYLNDDNKF